MAKNTARGKIGGTYIVVHTYQNLKTIKEYERQQKYENLYYEFR